MQRPQSACLPQPTSTNIVVLTVLFLASTRGGPRPWQIVLGQHLGFSTLVVVSILAALGLTIVPTSG